MGWIVFGGILLLLFLLAMTWIRIRVCYASEVELWVRFGLIKLKILPGKVKKINPRAFRIDRFRKMRIKKRALAFKKARKAEAKKTKKKAAKEKKKAEKKAGTAKKKKRSTKQTVEWILRLVNDVVFAVIKCFGRHLRVDVARLHVNVATGDAAKTAITYGAVTQSAAYLLTLLSETMHFDYTRNADVAIYTDYLSEKSTVEADITFRIRLWHIFAILNTAIIGFFKSLKPKKRK